MQKISTLPFAQLKNAEHVSFFTNVQVAINKMGAEVLGIAASQFNAYKMVVDVEQDIVNHSNASVYTPEMQAMDAERDRLFRLIRLKLQACTLAAPSDDVYPLINTIEKNLLSKYGLNIATVAYQEESALLRGFILDVRTFFDEDEIAMIGITAALDDLESYNNRFADQYNERVTEKSFGTTEAAKKARANTEELFHIIGLHLEYKANMAPQSEEGMACEGLIAVINELMRDARQRLNSRLGKTDSSSPSEEEVFEAEE